MFTGSPGTGGAEGGRGERLGDERDLEPVAPDIALTVRETPSTAIDPLRATSGASSRRG